MAVQKNKKSIMKTKSRFAQWKNRLSTPNLSECPQCHEYKESHKVCPSCGYYDGVQVINTEKKSDAE